MMPTFRTVPQPTWIVLHCSRWRPNLYRIVCFSENQGISNHFVFPSQIAKRRFQPGDLIAGTIDHRIFDVQTVFSTIRHCEATQRPQQPQHIDDSYPPRHNNLKSDSKKPFRCHSPEIGNPEESMDPHIRGDDIKRVYGRSLEVPLKLAILSCVTELLQLTLPEGHPYPHLYHAAEQLLQSLGERSMAHADLVAAYSAFELKLLAEIGFGLALDSCVVTGISTDLAYISPKTGSAVSQATGAAYHDKLLPFPDVWRTPPRGTNWEQALVITEFFIKKQLRAGQKMPFMRSIICNLQ